MPTGGVTRKGLRLSMTNLNRRSLFQGGLAVGAVGVLSACGTSTPSSTTSSATSAATSATSAARSPAADAGAITIWIDSNREPTLKPVAAQFKADTGVTVNLVIKDFSKIVDDFTTQAKTGKGPDAILAAHDTIGGMIRNGVLAPVELGDAAKQFQDVSVKAFTYEGKVYGVPYAIENLAMIRNTKLAATAPATWDQLIAAGKAAKTKYPVLIGMDSVTSASPYNLYPLQASFGAPVFNMGADGSYDATTIAMGGPEGQAFAKWLDAQVKAGNLNINISNDIAKDQFAKGQAPFFISGPWNLDLIKTAKLAYAIDPIPSAGGKPATPFVGVQGFCLSAKSTNAIATTKFLVEYLGSEKVQTELLKAGNRAPANQAAFDAAKSDKDVAAFGAVGAAGVPMPNVPAMGAVWADWGAAEAAIMTGKSKNPAADWAKMAQTIQGKI